MTLFDNSRLWTQLRSLDADGWADSLRKQSEEALLPDKHGKLSHWIAAWNQLPVASDAKIDASGDYVTVHGSISAEEEHSLRETLMQLHPWRKGPFNFFGMPIDTEWRSNLKWDRVAAGVDFRERLVLDVGCGNGYYGWRMLNAGAKMVLGLDPMPMYLMQFECVRRYASDDVSHFVLPLTDAAIPERLHLFDVAVSMGVLYHRTSPIDHLQSLWESLRPRGTLVLETLIIESESETVLVPEDRYAKMRNVWFIPSVPMLIRWVLRTGFRDIQVLDVSSTTSTEQRRTEWMTFESLSDFLHPEDATRTIEGHPGPRRALLTATRE